jgi:Ca-activated chloride channel homolog
MGRLILASAVLATPGVVALALPSQEQPAQVFRAGVDAVSVDAAVQHDRRPVIGLKATDFELRDNGVPQEITEVAYEKLPIDVTFLLDVSASVTGDVLDELRRALRQVRTDLGSGDRLRLLTFNMRVSRLVDFSQTASDLDAALASLRGFGSSAVFDGLAVALTAAERPGRRRLSVLFSDGQDSSSITDAETLLDVARRSTSTVAIVLSSPSLERPASLLRTTSAPASATVGALFERIAGETGGIVTSVKPGENLSSRFRRMLQEFRSSYVLYFTPRGVERTGAHTLEVRVKRPGVTVRARRGYVWQ